MAAYPNHTTIFTNKTCEVNKNCWLGTAQNKLLEARCGHGALHNYGIESKSSISLFNDL